MPSSVPPTRRAPEERTVPPSQLGRQQSVESLQRSSSRQQSVESRQRPLSRQESVEFRQGPVGSRRRSVSRQQSLEFRQEPLESRQPSPSRQESLEPGQQSLSRKESLEFRQQPLESLQQSLSRPEFLKLHQRSSSRQERLDSNQRSLSRPGPLEFHQHSSCQQASLQHRPRSRRRSESGSPPPRRHRNEAPTTTNRSLFDALTASNVYLILILLIIFSVGVVVLILQGFVVGTKDWAAGVVGTSFAPVIESIVSISAGASAFLAPITANANQRQPYQPHLTIAHPLTLMPDKESWANGMAFGNHSLYKLHDRLHNAKQFGQLPVFEANKAKRDSNHLERQIGSTINLTRSGVRWLLLELSEAPTLELMPAETKEEDDVLSGYWWLRDWLFSRSTRHASQQLKYRTEFLASTFKTVLEKQKEHVKAAEALVNYVNTKVQDPTCSIFKRISEEQHSMLLNPDSSHIRSKAKESGGTAVAEHIVTFLGEVSDIIDAVCRTVRHNHNKLQAHVYLMRREITFLEEAITRLKKDLRERENTSLPLTHRAVKRREQETLMGFAERWHKMTEMYYKKEE